MARENYKSKERNALKERQRVTNSVAANKEKQVGLSEYAERDKEKSEKNKVDTSIKWFRNRKNLLFKTNNIIVLLSTFLLLANTVGRGFKGDWAYLVINLLFIPIFLFSASYINPLDFSSDNKNYMYPKFNNVYSTAQKILTQIFSRMGKGLTNKPYSSLNLAMVIIIISNITNILFYSSNFEAIAIPIILIYGARVFAGNSFRSELGRLNIYKWILFVFLAISTITSIFWRTPWDYTLMVIITILNTMSIWFKNTYVYSISEIQ